MSLALATHIPVSEWLAAGDEAVATALELLEEQRRQIEAKG